ncbi:MAG: hypothetical protein IT345_09190 [Trueperaceae bacterium]|nr:hypothetical protein [Trueperaceae bacterium]
MSRFLDANVLLYSIGTAPAERPKRDVAIESWTRFPVHAVDLDLVRAALALRQRFRRSYWDAAIVATAKLSGCRELWSEELQHGQNVDGLHIVNPFMAI